MKHLLLSLALLIFLASCNFTAKTVEEKNLALGDIGYSFSLSEAAQKSFDKGFLLLHSFEYDDAREEFRAAQQADSSEVMAYWGLAMSHYKALWGLQNVDEGRKILAEFGEDKELRLAKIEDPVEKAFWQGVEILYGEGELKERNQKYVDHLEKVYEENPDNQEVATFLSLGLMWADYKNEDYLQRSSDIADKVLAVNPTHPGALHYKIHANDNPKNAPLALKAADKYAKVAPAAAHALHMPSHIYVALGMWNESVKSNIASYQASLDRVARKELNGKDRGYHSMAWLHYSYLQQGNYEEATMLLSEMQDYFQDSTHSDYYLINMQNQQLVETGEWPSTLSPIDVNYNKLGLEGKAGLHFFKAGLAFRNGNKTELINNINELGAHCEAGRLLIKENGVALCSAGATRYAPTKTGIKRTEVVIHQMQAMLAMLSENKEAAEKHMLAATALETECGYDPGPPFIAYPSYEQYGEWLLTQGRPADALAQFNKCLEGRTNRAKSLKGKASALKALGKKDEAKAVKSTLDTFYKSKELVSM